MLKTLQEKEQHLFEIEIFWNIMNVFTVTADRFNASIFYTQNTKFLQLIECNALIAAFSWT